MPPSSEKKDQRDARQAALEAEADRVSLLSLPQLAAEVMARAFNVAGTAYDQAT